MLSLLFLIPISTSYGQSYNKAKVYLDNHLVIKATNLEISGNKINFLNKANGRNESNMLSAVSLIKIPKSNYLLEGSLFGAGTLALTALLIDIDPDPLLDKKRGADFYIGYTAVGAVVGALVGVLIPKWKSIYSGGKFIGLNGPLNVDFNTQNDQFNIKISIAL